MMLDVSEMFLMPDMVVGVESVRADQLAEAVLQLAIALIQLN